MVIKYLTLIVLGFAACNIGQQTNKAVRKMICGVYVRQFQQEYAVGNDTLIIKQPDEHNNYYVIEHKVTYRQIINKNIQPVQYKEDRWQAMYDEKMSVLREQKHGIMLSFMPNENTLLMGNAEYTKVKH